VITMQQEGRKSNGRPIGGDHYCKYLVILKPM
jgi:hypothetical protein